MVVKMIRSSLLLLLVVMCVRVSWCVTEEASLKDIVLTLKGQVAALLERRQEDYRMLADSMKTSLAKSLQLSSLRTEVEVLRKEVDGLNGVRVSNRQKNDHVTVEWLATTVGELRKELTEVAGAYNVSGELQQRQETRTELGMLRGDLAALRREAEEMQAEQQRCLAKIIQVQQEIGTIRTQSQNTAALCTDLKSQLQTAQTEWTITLKSMKKKNTFRNVLNNPLKLNDDFPNHETNEVFGKMKPSVERKYRHNRDIRLQMQELGTSEQQLHSSQVHLDHRLRRLEKQLKSVLYRRAGGAHEGAVAEDLRRRVASLEQAGRTTEKAVFNASRQLADVDKIHQAVLELLESVEGIETRVDKAVPDLQREISKMEFNMARMTSSVALIKEEQETQGASNKAIANSIVSVEEVASTNRGHITGIQARLLNLTVGKTGNCETAHLVHATRLDVLEKQIQSVIEHENVSRSSENPIALTVGEGYDEKNNSNPVPRLVQQLHRVQQEYKEIIQRLPRDCSGVSGPSGLYLISPTADAASAPLLTYCDQESGEGGWTMVQRRSDGSQQFNRNWEQYARGFGSPSGEFWLGNDALHRLTADNCSSLRVDLQDIYGKTWVAEYAEFSVSPSSDGYRLHVASYTGNASDALDYQNRMQFSTVDSDRDISNTHCAGNYEGGWWFSHCQHANLNGKYTLGLTWFDKVKNEWIAVARSEMKVKRRTNCKKLISQT